MAIQEKFTVTSRVDTLKLSGLYMQPDQKPCKGIVQILHGMSEHKERYIPFMEFLADCGYASIIHDHRGHGESVKEVSDLGYMYEVGTDGFLDDVFLINGLAREKQPNIPLILFGHSMGSLAARSFLRKHDDVVDGVILSGAPCKNPAVGIAQLLAKLQKKIFGAKHPAVLLNNISFMSYSKRFPNEGSSFAWLNSDPAEVAVYDADPACGFVFSVDGFETLFELLSRTFKMDGWQCKNKSVPVLLIAGENDPCIGSRELFLHEVGFMKSVGYTDVEAVLYPGMRHEILLEPEKEKVFFDVKAYLEHYFGGTK